MSDNIHPAELFARQTLLRHPRAEQQARQFVEGKADGTGPNWPDWCGLPMAAAYSMLTDGADVSRARQILADEDGTLELSNLTAALLWRRGRIVYRFDPDLAAALSAQPLEGDIPREALYHLPYFCVFVERTQPLPQGDSIGFFAWMEWDVNNQMPELRLLYLLRSGYTIAAPVLLPGGTLADSRSALLQSALRRAQEAPSDLILSDGEAGTYGSLTGSLTGGHTAGDINMLLYLCADNADDGGRPELERRRSRDSGGAPKRPAVLTVGTRIGAAIRAAAAAPRESRPTGAQHASPIPHIRRAHWHNFWAGPRDGERKLVLHWLPPIPVNADDNNDVTTIRPVKGGG